MVVKKFSQILVVAVLLWSCSNEKPTTDAVTTASQPELNTPVPAISDTSNTTSTTQIQSAPVTVTPSSASTVKGSGGKLNPEHGQPGHKCEIPVGAPLDGSAATSTTATPKAAPPVAVKPTAPAANTTTAPGMNPAHGQPGHRCDIAVGAPLDSKPKQ